jgi:pantothenate kinase
VVVVSIAGGGSGPLDHRLLARLRALASGAAPEARRRVLGITGPPGAGKTTLVHRLLEAAAADPLLAGRVAHVPMDGFHRTDAELDRLGRRDHKGAPDTFDPVAYAHVLGAVRALPRRVVLAPAFDHAVGEPEPGAITIDGVADLVVTEGNYLLLPDPEWVAVRSLLDEVWFCALDDGARRERLVARHVEAGREPAAATAWVDRSDEANARLVSTTVVGADVVVVDGIPR